MKNNIYVKILYLNNEESEILKSDQIDLEVLKEKENVRGIRLCYEINGQMLEQDDDILFGERVSLKKLKREHYDNEEYKKYIDELEQAGVTDVAFIRNRYYTSLYDDDMTYDEFVSFMTYDKLDKVELADDLDLELQNGDKFITIAEYYSKENEAILSFILNILMRLENQTPEEVINYLFEFGLPEDFICEIVSVCSYFSPNGLDLLNYWNDNFYILKSAHSKIKLVRA